MVHTLDSSFLHKQGIDTLLGALIKLKNPKISEFTPDELWTGDIVRRSVCHFCHVLPCSTLTILSFLRRLNNFQHGDDESSLLSESQACLQSLKKVEALLANLQESLRQATTLLESTLSPFRLGRRLSSLPDSILSLIFESFCTQDRTWQIYRRQTPHSRLSLVSRRFRDVVSSSPRLWNLVTIDVRLETEIIKVFLRRSKAAGLDIILSAYSEVNIGRILQRLAAALLHSQRWETLHLKLGSMEGRGLEDILSTLCSLHLPRLQSLTIHYPNPTVPLPSQHFYKTCELGMLRSFHITNIVPEPFTAPLLTSFSFVISKEGYVNSIFSSNDLLYFLSANPALEDIHISLSKAVVYGPEVLRDVILENVENFKLTLGCVHLDKLYPFRSALWTPNVRKFSLEIVEGTWSRSEEESNNDEVYLQSRDWKDTVGSNECLEFALCHDSYPRLDQFYYEYQGEDRRMYDLPFHKMPKLRVLMLRTDSWPELPEQGSIPPSLRKLHVYLDSLPDENWQCWFADFYTRMRMQGIQSDFENLFIEYYDCTRNIEKVYRGRVVWTRRT